VVQRDAVTAKQPRDRHGESRAVAYLMLASSPYILITGAIMPVGQAFMVTAAATVITALLAVGGALCWRRADLLPDYFWVGAPFFAVTVVAGVDILTSDASTGAQVFFLWPVLYAATFLSRRLNVIVLLTVCAGEAAVVFTMFEATRAISDIVTMMTALIMSSVVVLNIRERRDQLLGALETQAMADPLTGLSNRRSFDRDLALADAWARRAGGALSLLTVDVDHFKAINDTWGHAIGDLALQAVAGAMRAATREPDVIARLGGDEFVMLLRCDRPGALRVAGALRDAVAASDDLPGGPPSLSIGLAVLPHDAGTVEGLLAASDAALYSAKVNGRNRVATAGAPNNATHPTRLP
jgi:diguanylate cyclase (GGDEF)-like protein